MKTSLLKLWSILTEDRRQSPDVVFILRQKCKVNLVKQIGFLPSVLTGLTFVLRQDVLHSGFERPRRKSTWISWLYGWVVHETQIVCDGHIWLFMCVLTQKTKHSQWLGDPVKAFVLVTVFFITALFLMKKTGRKIITLDNHLQRLGTCIPSSVMLRMF